MAQGQYLASLRDQWARVQLGEDTPLGRAVVQRLAGPLATVPGQVRAIVEAPVRHEAAWDLLLEAETDHRVLTHLGPVTGTPHTSEALLRALVHSLDRVARLGASAASPLRRDRAHRLLRAIATAGGPTPDTGALPGAGRPVARQVPPVAARRPAPGAPARAGDARGAGVRRAPLLPGQPIGPTTWRRQPSPGSTRKDAPALTVKQFLARYDRGR